MSETITVKGKTYSSEETREFIINTDPKRPDLAEFLNYSRSTTRHVSMAFYALFPETKPFVTLKSYKQKILAAEGKKYCKTCDTIKELSEFHPKGKNYQPKCKSCDLQTGLLWQKNNRGKAKSHTVKYMAAKLNRTPPWADLDSISFIYENCPPGMHVDHIIPLQGKLVSGLHVPENLQYLTPEENRQKGNRYEP